ncbi:MAG: HDOD domain-containing protein [Planctomycetota bacterium]|jgi:HD-like signal output (HDOD) protein
MGALSKIREHAAISSGNFSAMFKDAKIPQLPAAVACLIEEFNKEEPEIRRLTEIISSDLEVSTKILRTVNSALYGLPNQVKSIQNGIMLLGLRSIRTIALSYTLKASIPKPKGKLFDQEAFWTDSLLRALLARSLASHHTHVEKDETFTASLLSNLAIPVLLSTWGDYYSPVVEQWRDSNQRLSRLEREDFGWDHAQAGAWILKLWDFPDEMVGLIGAHSLSIEEIRQHGLGQTIALPVATASLLPSVLRPSLDDCKELIDRATENFSMTPIEFGYLIRDIGEKFEDIRDMFGLRDRNACNILESICEVCDPQPAENPT